MRTVVLSSDCTPEHHLLAFPSTPVWGPRTSQSQNQGLWFNGEIPGACSMQPGGAHLLVKCRQLKLLECMCGWTHHPVPCTSWNGRRGSAAAGLRVDRSPWGRQRSTAGKRRRQELQQRPAPGALPNSRLGTGSTKNTSIGAAVKLPHNCTHLTH